MVNTKIHAVGLEEKKMSTEEFKDITPQKTNGHKLALLYTMRYLLKESDENHPVNAGDISRYLEAHGLSANRRTIYADIAVLEEFGMDILMAEGGKSGGYYLASRDFELPELKLLVDAVQSSKFITEKKSATLIGKLSALTSAANARKLERTVYIRNRVKTENENIFYTVDTIHEAIQANKQIAFLYGEMTLDKKIVARRGGARYQVSPWALTWDDENYYMIAYDDLAEKIKFYRVDKMLKVRVVSDVREGAAYFKDFDLAAFAKKTFGMFGGHEEQVTLRCENHLAGVIVDRFGNDVRIIKDGDGHFKASATVDVSPQFFGWITGVGKALQLVAPESVRKEYLRYLKEVAAAYEG